MFKGLVSTVFGVAVISAFVAAPAVPATAQDIETKVQLCAACHGPNGEPLDPKTMPIIWGQQSNYLYKELHDFHSGARENPLMGPVAKGFSLPELRQLANYFAAKTWPAGHGSGAPVPAAGWRAAFVEEIPMGRPMAPEEIAGVCAFLAGDAAAAITGQAINVSGGHEMH